MAAPGIESLNGTAPTDVAHGGDPGHATERDRGASGDREPGANQSDPGTGNSRQGKTPAPAP